MIKSLQHFPKQETDFSTARSRCLLEAGGGEDLGGGEAAEVPPVISIRSESDSGVIVSENPAGNGIRPVGEDGVVSGEALLGCGGRGDDDDGEAAEVKLHHGAVLLGESLQGEVRRRFEEVEVAAYWQRRRAWRRILAVTWIQMLWNQENADAYKHAAQ